MCYNVVTEEREVIKMNELTIKAMRKTILEMLAERPKGMLKREMFSPGNRIGHLALNELEDEGKVEKTLYRDIGNMEDYYIYTLKRGE